MVEDLLLLYFFVLFVVYYIIRPYNNSLNYVRVVLYYKSKEEEDLK